MNNIIDGKKVADEILVQVAADVASLASGAKKPVLAVIMVGANPASVVYVSHKKKSCEKVGMTFQQLDFPETITTQELMDAIQRLNDDENVHGILVQMPLPAHVYTPDVMKAISPYKDVDGFTAYNIGKMVLSPEFEELVPCTPRGVIKLLEYYHVEISGAEVCVVGSSNIVGKPLAMMLSNRKATVTICNSKTKDLADHVRRADIVCVAIGKPHFVTADMVKDGAVVIDVGINRLPNGKLAGDVDFEHVSAKARLITPVPGGVGPMTVACLMENVLRAYKRLEAKKE